MKREREMEKSQEQEQELPLPLPTRPPTTPGFWHRDSSLPPTFFAPSCHHHQPAQKPSRRMPGPTSYFLPLLLLLTTGFTVVLDARKQGGVLHYLQSENKLVLVAVARIQCRHIPVETVHMAPKT